MKPADPSMLPAEPGSVNGEFGTARIHVEISLGALQSYG